MMTMNMTRTEAAFGRRVENLGEGIALAGVVLPLLLIGLLKFTPAEVAGLKPLISGTPWLAWLYPVFGEARASYLLGVVEITTGFLLLASQWSWRAGLAGGALGTLAFATTVSILFALPVWEGASGGFPWLNFLGSFLIKDVALLGISVAVLGRSLSGGAGSPFFARRAIAR